MEFSSLTAVYFALGLVGGWAFFRYSKSYGRAQRKLLAHGLVIAALVYVVFAAIGRDFFWLGYESLGVLAFAGLAWLGVKKSALWLAAGWALHPLWDFGLHAQGAGAALAPEWYVVACLSFDLLVAALIFKDVQGPGA